MKGVAGHPSANPQDYVTQNDRASLKNYASEGRFIVRVRQQVQTLISKTFWKDQIGSYGIGREKPFKIRKVWRIIQGMDRRPVHVVKIPFSDGQSMG